MAAGFAVSDGWIWPRSVSPELTLGLRSALVDIQRGTAADTHGWVKKL